jgi:uncharacterized protein YciI
MTSPLFSNHGRFDRKIATDQESTGQICRNLLSGVVIVKTCWKNDAPYRQAHLEGLNQQKERGILITIGPTADLSQVFAIYQAASESEVRELIEADPYWQNGIWTEYQVKEWIQAI